jgi:CDP-diacylglycerol--glycerol-3-phosphate 3-phosphatidyltransferase
MAMPIAPAELRGRVRRAAEPVALALGRLGLSPNALTLLGFGVALLAAGAAAVGAFGLAGLLVLVGGAFDLLDGVLARATGRASRLGAFLDSVFDRAGEAAVYVGLVAGGIGAGLPWLAVLAAAAMATAFLVSYSRARAEGLDLVGERAMATVGLAPREVRLVLLGGGLLVGAGLGVGSTDFAGGALAVEAALGLIAVLAGVTTAQRIRHIVDQERSMEQEPSIDHERREVRHPEAPDRPSSR